MTSRPAAASHNDNFANPQVLSFDPTGVATFRGFNLGATLQLGEPQPTCVTSSSASVWFRFTATAAEEVQADTFGSNFDTVLSAHTGTSLTTLRELACNNDADATLQSRIGFGVTAGNTYWLRVASFGTTGGNIQLTVRRGVANLTPPSLTPTATPLAPTLTPTASPTPLPPIGGLGFSLRLGPPFMSWTGGSAQTGYLVARIAGSGTTILPVGGLPLPPNATSYTDTLPIRDPFICYLLVPIGPPGALGISDLLCGLPGTRSIGGAPGAFTVRFDPSAPSPRTRADLTWTAPGRQDNYLLVALPLGGGVPRQLPLPSDAVRATEDTGGVPTCYLLQVRAGTATIGHTDVLCAFPGVSTLAAARSPAR